MHKGNQARRREEGQDGWDVQMYPKPLKPNTMAMGPKTQPSHQSSTGPEGNATFKVQLDHNRKVTQQPLLRGTIHSEEIITCNPRARTGFTKHCASTQSFGETSFRNHITLAFPFSLCESFVCKSQFLFQSFQTAPRPSLSNGLSTPAASPLASS